MQTLIDKPLLHKIKVEESLWSVDKDRSLLTINLEKTKEIMWKSVLQGEDGIDLSKVDTTRDISEFDPECQAAIQRVTYDEHMKRLGKPTSGQKVGVNSRQYYLMSCFVVAESSRHAEEGLGC